MRTRSVGCAVGLGLALALAACGSGSNAANTATTSSGATTPSSSGATTSTTTSTTTPASSSTSTAASSTTTTAAGPTACVAGELAISFLGQQGATGHGLLGFALHNTGSTPCHTYGYPGIAFLSSTGSMLPTQTTRTTHDFFGSAPEVAIILQPGATASFRVGVTHVATGAGACTTAAALQVIAPDDTATLHAQIPAGGAYECGTATVSPVRPGTSAYP